MNARPVGVLGCLLLAGCSGLLGLDEFSRAENSGGAGGVAGNAGVGGTGAAGGVAGNAGHAGVAGTSSGGSSGASTGGTSSGGAGGAGSCTPTEEEDCYSGGASTLDKGICHAGKRVCGGDSTWGACNGEVLPAVEDCSDSTKDENCDGFECGIWGVGSGGRAHFLAHGVAGDFAVAGTFVDGANVFGSVFHTSGALGVFLAQFAPDGTVNWVTPFASGGTDLPYGLTVSPDGTITVVATLAFPADLGDGPKAAGYRMITLAPSGALVRSEVLPSAADYVATASDSGGNVIVVGFLNGSATYGTTNLTSTNEDPLVVKYRPDGTVVWAKNFEGPEDDQATAVAIGPSDEVFVVGYASGTIGFGNGTHNVIGRDGFFVALDSDGVPGVEDVFGGPGDQSADQVTVDGAGVVTLSGEYSQGFQSHGRSLSAVSQKSTFALRAALRNFSLDIQWVSGVTNVDPYGLAARSDGGAVLVGRTTADTIIGGEAAAASVGVVVALDSSGQHRWHRVAGGPVGACVATITTVNDEVLAVGHTNVPTVDLGSGRIDTGPDRMYLQKLGR